MPPLDASMPHRISAAAARALETFHVPGISIGVVRGDELVYCEAFGYADIESRAPMDPTRRQCIASISKTMVGLCTMALVDEGRLRLDQPVGELLPDVRFHGPADEMTVWNLLTHTGGIGEAATRDTLAATVNPDADLRRKAGDFASMYEQGIEIEVPANTKWHYANHGYNLLGEIIVRAEGARHLNDVMQRRIFGPLGMTDTDILGEDSSKLTTPYHRAPTEDARVQLERAGIPVKDEPTVDGHNIRGRFGGEFNKSALAAGGVQSTVPDMAKYASALLRRGAGIVRPETFEQMVAPHYCPDARFAHWGLSFMRHTEAGRMIVGHGGAYFGGWNSNLGISLEDNVGIIQHMNVMMDDPGPVFSGVTHAVFDERPPQHAPKPADAQVLDQAPGLYELTMPGTLTNFRPATSLGRVRIERAGDGLTLHARWGKWKAGVPMIPADASDPLFFVIQLPDAEIAPLVFLRGESGQIEGLRCNRLVHMVRRPDEPPEKE